MCIGVSGCRGCRSVFAARDLASEGRETVRPCHPVFGGCASLMCFWNAGCANGLVCGVSGTASASDLARLECELWQTQNGIWNADVLVYDAVGMCFVRAGFVVHVSGTASASD